MTDLPRVTIDGVLYEVHVKPRHSVGLRYHVHPEAHPADEAPPLFQDEDFRRFTVAQGASETAARHHHCDQTCERRTALLVPLPRVARPPARVVD